MLYIYKLFTFLLEPFLVLILKKRVLKGKEDPERFKEKLGETKNTNLSNVVWFHVASLGEIKSISPIVKYYQKKPNINILITTVTLSSYNFFKENLETKNTVHQYAPLDGPRIVKKFIKYWQPKISIFVESEIWPNLIEEASKQSKLILLNCRISKNSFAKWKTFKKVFTSLILKFHSITVQNKETARYLKYFGIENIKNFGNLKFIKDENKKPGVLKINQTNRIWAAMSIHYDEVENIIETHQKLVTNYDDITTFLIPRHLNKISSMKTLISEKKINLQLVSENPKIDHFNGIVIVDKFGIADDVFDSVKIVFMGGSFINHGGQNPIEPARFGCKIFHGKNIFNFTEIYDLLEKNNISKLTKNPSELSAEIDNYLKDDNVRNSQKNVSFSDDVFIKTTNYLNDYIL